ncbi:asparagine synthase-related protein [Streptomyces sp. NPDC056716]|uniref:asparagine synthase-related protein n=1 Tax=unclassified Streptomyces TaxID=2593676 RepID=UPI0036CC6C9F
MIKMQLTGPPDAGGWQWTGHRWVSGRSWIEPFAHPAIEHVMVTAPASGRSCLIARETARDRQPVTMLRCVTRDPYYRRQVEEAADWPLQAVRVELTAGQGVRITCGERGVAPLYLRPADGELRVSWDLLDLASGADELDAREAAAMLAYRSRYSTATVFRSIHRLTERATAAWDPTAGLNIAYPTPALHSLPRTLHADADPVDAFRDLLRREVTARPLATDACAVELSGGMDSAMTALALAETAGPVRTAALLLGGEVGEQQRRRRREISARACLGRDLTVPVGEFAPFHPTGPRARGLPTSPTDGTYVEAMSELYGRLSAAGVRWVFTGIGGDELCFQRPEERALTGDPWNLHPLPGHLGPRARDSLPYLEDDLAPASVLHASTLLALAVHSATAMRHGLWPISPLATPLVLRFGESLPPAWRRGKRLMRLRLRQAGYSPEVVDPPLRENFAATCETAMRQDGLPLLRRWLPDSVLALHGLLDPVALEAECTTSATTGQGASAMYRPLALEAALRSLATPAAAPTL